MAALVACALAACRVPVPATRCESHTDCPPTYVCLEERGYCVPGDAGIALQPGVSGLERDVQLTPGQSLLLRAIAHSDGVGLPFVALLRPADQREVSSQVGTITSTRDAPDVLVLTAEVPEDSATLRVVLGNASAGTVYWHQVELLPNLMRNPSFERFGAVVTESGESIRPPESWMYPGRGEVRREGGKVHSGRASVRLIGDFVGFKEVLQAVPDADNGDFYAVGGFFWNFLGDAPGIHVHNGSLYFQHEASDQSRMKLQARAGNELGLWYHLKGVGRRYRTGERDLDNYNDLVCWGADTTTTPTSPSMTPTSTR